MFVYKVLWIFTVKCLQLFNKELYVYFCTDSILSCFSWIQPITVTKAAALVHFAMTWLDTMALHWCYCRSKGRTLACFVSFFKDRNQGGPAHPQHTWHSLRHNCSRSSVCPGARLGLYLERPQQVVSMAGMCVLVSLQVVVWISLVFLDVHQPHPVTLGHPSWSKAVPFILKRMRTTARTTTGWGVHWSQLTSCSTGARFYIFSWHFKL